MDDLTASTSHDVSDLKPAILALADGQLFEGFSVGAAGDSVGELVFNTAMTGYQEMLSDPSYLGQMITLTTAHVGNTGCNEADMESKKVWASGVVMRNCSLTPSNYRSQYSFPQWLKKQGVVAITGVDTRALTIHLRTHGAIAACISTSVANPQAAIDKARAFVGFEHLDLAFEASCTSSHNWEQGCGEWRQPSKPDVRFKVVVYDFGVKTSILRILQDKGCDVTVVPAKTPVSEVMTMEPDGVVFSNGPGDPKVCDYAIAAAKEFLQQDVPLLGICLGFQILALACGASSMKMKFGHHGANHPVLTSSDSNIDGTNAANSSADERVYITSQNHSFAIDEASLPDCLVVTHRSLFDQSLQGIRHRYHPALGFQGHPEASPGPHEVDIIFDDFIRLLEVYCARTVVKVKDV